jgi:dimethylamine/trimethylamine dehydrogenase
VLIVGAGPAGLECAQALGRRGYEVHLAEATRELGGRVSRESRLHGLGEWARVRDWRVGQIQAMPNVTVYRESPMSAADIATMDFANVIIATGSSWRRDGFGRRNHKAIAVLDGTRVLTPDDVMDGIPIEGSILVFDDDDYYMGGVVAETLRHRGHAVALATPSPLASAWTVNTLEQEKIQSQLLRSGIEILPNVNLAMIGRNEVSLACVFTGRLSTRAAANVVLVTARIPERRLYDDLTARMEAGESGAVRTVTRIGDCIAPGTIAYAVFSGRRVAEELDEPKADILPFRTEPLAVDRPLTSGDLPQLAAE